VPILMFGELALTALAAKLVADGAGGALNLHAGVPLSGWSLALTAVLGVVVGDLASYLAHYLMHFVPALWEIHKVHHSATVLNPFTSSRSHPIERKLQIVISSLLTGLFFGIVFTIFKTSITELLVEIAIAKFIISTLTLEFIRHSDMNISFGIFERIFVSPRFHQLHHSVESEHWNKNIGIVFSFWDFMFGTAHPVRDGQTFRFGTGEGSVADGRYNGLYGGFVRPVINMFEVIARRPTPPDAASRPATRHRPELGPAPREMAD